MSKYSYKVVRKSDGELIHSDTIDDVMNAGKKAMKLTIVAGLLHFHPKAQGLTGKDVTVRMTLID